MNPALRGALDDRRLSGPIGDLVAGTQDRVLANFAGRIHERDILAVGGGSERAALLFAHGGAKVTAVEPSETTLNRLRHRAAAELVKIEFRLGDPRALSLPDRSFDIAVGLRLLMHTPEWRRYVSELCRVAERLVVLDYFPVMSVSLPGAMVRRVTRTLGGRSATYRVVRHAAIVEALDQSGFSVRSVHRQFVLPYVLHRAIGSRRFTIKSERMLDHLGLLKLLGTPVTLVAERSASLNEPPADGAAWRRH
ncbi:MAG: class I SAM-dependent methyltransferase [Acidobacteriia bacterium]|nr:class I SAM-dependent methyltransferase [Terriglobia bacterium]